MSNSAPDYYELVYEVVSVIPAGRVTTYGYIADFLALGSARMVGYALRNMNRFGQYDIPAHRVVNSKGELSGRHMFRPPSLMKDRLNAEDISVINDRIKDFEQKLWIPAKELI